MAHKLIDQGTEGPISPLIDVVMNGMAAMFILLMVYLFVARPDQGKRPEELRFLGEVQPLPAVAEQNYIYTFPVVGGMGQRRFALRGDLPPDLNFDEVTGTIHGVPRQVSNTKVNEFGVQVQDAEFEDQSDFKLILHPAAIPYDPEAVDFSVERRNEILPDARVGVDYEAVLGGQGGVPPYRWRLLAGTLPRGLRLSEGRLAGRPEQAGDFEFQVQLSYIEGSFLDRGVRRAWAGGVEQRRFQLRTWGPLALSLETPVGRVGEPYLLSLAGDPLVSGERLAWSGGVPGLDFSADQRVLRGVPETAGTFEVAYTLSRNGEPVASDSGELLILPRRPRSRVAPGRVAVRQGEELRFTPAYRGLREPVTVRWREPLPAGLQAMGDTLVGNPTTVSRTGIPFEVEDALGEVTTGEIDLFVHPPRKPLAILAAPMLEVLVARPVEFPLAAEGGEGNHRWELGGSPPPGWALSPEGVLAGRLEQAGAWNVELRLHDEASEETVRRALTIQGYHAESSALRWDTRVLPPAVVGQPYEISLAVVGGVGEPRFEVEGDLPEGLRFDAGRILGTPLRPANSRIVARVEDTVGQSAEPLGLEITTLPADASRPMLVTEPPLPLRAGSEVRFDFAAEGGVGRYTWRFEGDLPAGLRFSERGLRGFLSPQGPAGLYPVEVVVADALGRQAKQIYQLRILPLEQSENFAPSEVPAVEPWLLLCTLLGFAASGISYWRGKAVGRESERRRATLPLRSR